MNTGKILKKLRERNNRIQDSLTWYQQPSVCKIESRKDMKVSNFIDFLFDIGYNVEFHITNIETKEKIICKSDTDDIIF